MATQQLGIHQDTRWALPPTSDSPPDALSPRDQREQQLAQYLGWFSVGLGAAELAAPQTIANLIGLHQPDGWLPIFGVREIASGVGIFSQRRPVASLWSRVAGDMIDLAYLMAATVNPRNNRFRLAMAMGAVAGVTVLDILAAELQSRRPHALRGKPKTSSNIVVRKSFTINRSAEDLYQYWHNFENLPNIMRHLKSVTCLLENRSHWVAYSPTGTVEWDAEVIEEIPNQRIAWKSTGGDVHNAGFVAFQPAPGNRGTEMKVEVIYQPPYGALGATVAWFTSEDPEFQIQEDLRRFKQVMETGEYATTEGQPTGRGGRTLIPGL